MEHHSFFNLPKKRPRKVEEDYSPERVQRLKRIIVNLQNKGAVKMYSITIDGEIIVARTEDIEEFDDHLDFVEPDSKVIEIRTFFGSSPNCNLYQFFVHGKPQQTSSGLGAIEINDRIQDALYKQQLETSIKLLEKDNKNLEEQTLLLKKKLKKYKKLQSKLDEKQIDINDLFTKGIELFGAFQGKKMGADKQVEGLPQVTTVDVEAIEEKTPAQDHFDQLKSTYSDEQLLKAMKTSEVFVRYPDLREEFQAIVKSKMKKNE
jgi:hypothetical protein